MGIRYYWFTATIILTVLGAGLFIWRLNPDEKGGSVMNIDFVGGTAYTGKLAKPLAIGELRDKLENEREGARHDRARKRPARHLPIEQIFAHGDTGGRELASSPSAPPTRTPARCQKIINTRLGDDSGNHIELHKYDDRPTDDKTRDRWSSPSRRSDEPDFASRARVDRCCCSEEGLTRNIRASSRSAKAGRRTAASREMKIELSEPLSRDEVRGRSWPRRKDGVRQQPAAGTAGELRQPSWRPNTQERALYAILASWAAILLYLWFRFGNWTFGAAAVLCLIHDLFFTLGIIAACHYIHGTVAGQPARHRATSRSTCRPWPPC